MHCIARVCVCACVRVRVRVRVCVCVFKSPVTFNKSEGSLFWGGLPEGCIAIILVTSCV